jgi:hypothetical protein
MFCPAFRSEILHPFNMPTYLTRVETFPGAACSTRFAVMQRAKTNIVGPLGTIQSGSPPGFDLFYVSHLFPDLFQFGFGMHN